MRRHRPRLGIERGRVWHNSWRMAGLEGPLRLTRTTSWLLGKLRVDLHRGTHRVAEVIPEDPWRYRSTLEVHGELAGAEAVFVLWAASRTDARRLQSRIQRGTGAASGGGAVG